MSQPDCCSNFQPTGQPKPTGSVDIKNEQAILLAARRSIAANQPQPTGLASVENALLNDENAPQSLAAEFSNGRQPKWYKDLPNDMRQTFITQDSATSAFSYRPSPSTSPAVTISSVKVVDQKKAVAAESSSNALRMEQVRLTSKYAALKSSIATMEGISQLAAEASSISQQAAQASRSLVSASQSIRAAGGAASHMVSTPSTMLVFSVTFAVAVGSLMLALVL